MSKLLQNSLEHLIDIPSVSSLPSTSSQPPIYGSAPIQSVTEQETCYGLTSLNEIVKQKDHRKLHDLGFLDGIASTTETNVEKGISGSSEEINHRQKVFGSNTYKIKEPSQKNFWYFMVEAFKDPTTVALLLCAAFSFAFGIIKKGHKQGWYDGGSIFINVFLAIAISSVRNFIKSTQSDKSSQVSNDIKIDVLRYGRQ